MKISIDRSKLSNHDKVQVVLLDIQQSEKKLNDMTQKLLTYFKKCGFKETDFRHHNLSMIFETLIWIKFHRQKFVEEANSNGKTIQFYLKGLGDHNLYGFLDQFDILNRVSFASTINFQFEIVFRGLLEEMKIIPKNDEFYWIVRSLTDKIYSDYEEKKKKRRILNTMAQVRNTLHNSGIHTSKYEFEIELEGIKYKFETGKRFQGASWTDLFIIINAMLEIFIEIFSSKEIKRIPYIPKK